MPEETLIHRFFVPQFRPVSLNQMLRKHWRTVSRMTNSDKEIIGFYFKQARLPVATKKRKVSLIIRLKPRAKVGDDDNFWKTSLDALVACGALLGDSKRLVSRGTLEYERGTSEDFGTWIVLEEVLP